jgi:hypothetical protein
MKHLLLAALLAVSAAQAAPPQAITLKSADGSVTYSLYPVTLMSGLNTLGYPQASMVLEMRGKDVSTRDRITVAGCRVGAGQMAFADETGMAAKPDAIVREWIDGGGRALDQIAGVICMALDLQLKAKQTPPAVRKSGVFL